MLSTNQKLIICYNVRNLSSNIREYVFRNGKIKDDNFSITHLNPYTIQISIHSSDNKNLSNLELLGCGFNQIAESLVKIGIPYLELFELFKLLKERKTTVEIGFPIKNNTLRELRKDFVVGKWYKIYDSYYSIDTSIGIELDFKLKTSLNNLVNSFKLIENFKLYNKGIIEIDGFEITASNEPEGNLKNNISNFE